MFPVGNKFGELKTVLILNIELQITHVREICLSLEI